MLFFWLIILVVIVVLSFLLASRSMKNSVSKIKPPETPQALFLIRNPEMINNQFLEKLHQILFKESCSISFETLFKGDQQATALFGPQDLPGKMLELDLLELEDYLIPKEETFSTKNPKKVNADQAFVWVVPIEPSMGKISLTDPSLGEEEQFFYQIILKPIMKKEEKLFKVTLRAMAATQNKLDKVRFAKSMFTKVNQNLGIGSDKLQSSSQAFNKYQFRLPEGETDFTISDTIRIL